MNVNADEFVGMDLPWAQRKTSTPFLFFFVFSQESYKSTYHTLPYGTLQQALEYSTDTLQRIASGALGLARRIT